MSQTAPEFFITGGTLPHDALCYVERLTDQQLFESLRRGEFCYVLTSRQMGKSSLMIRTALRLRETGIRAVVLDLTALGLNLTAIQWYRGMLCLLGQQLDLEAELEHWWKVLAELSPVQRFMEALRRVLQSHLTGSLVIFIDEIDVVRGLPFSADEFFAAIRECYNRRSSNAELTRLTFALLGVARPSDLIQDTRNTPFNVGRRIELQDFTEREASILGVGLQLGGAADSRTRSRDEALRILRRVLYWTGGHPYLTQRLCQQVASGALDERDVDRACERLFLSASAQERDDNLLFVRERMIRSGSAIVPETEEVTRLLLLYGRVLRGKKVPADDAEGTVALLRLTGVVKAERGRLVVRNRIYRHVFHAGWITRHLPTTELQRQREAYRRALIRTGSIATGVVLLVSGLAAYGLVSARTATRLRQQALRLVEDREEALQEMRELHYVALIRSAWTAVLAEDFPRAKRLLEEARPRPGEPDLRGWEWRYLWSRCHQGLGMMLQPGQAINWISFIQDGTRLALGVADGSVEIWKVADREREFRLPPPMGFSTDWQSITADGSVLVRTKEARHSSATSDWWIELHRRNGSWGEPEIWRSPEVGGLALSPDGALLAVLEGGRGKRFVRLRDLKRNTDLQLRLPKVPARCVDFSKDGSRLAVGCADGSVSLIPISRSGPVVRFNGRPVPVAAVSLSRDARRLGVAYQDGWARVLDTASRRVLAEWGLDPGHPMEAELSPNGQLLATTTYVPRRRAITRGAISIWDASRGQRIATLEGHTAEVTALTFTADSRTLVSAGGDGQVRLWEAREPPAHREALAAPFRIHRVLASTDGQRLMVRGTDRTEFRELATLNLIASREGPRGTLFDVRPDLREGAFGESDLVNLYDFMNMEQILQFRQLRARSLIYSPDSRWIVLGGDDGTVSVWETEKRVRKLEFHPVHDPVRVLAVSPRREHLAVLENDGRIRFYNPETGRESRAPLEKPGRAGRATFSPDGRWLAVDDVAGVRLHDLRKGEMRVLNASGLRLGRFAFAPDSRTLVATYGEPTIWLWNVATGQEMGAIRGCHSGYDSACFSADGTQLIAGGRDGCVTSWRALPPEGLSQQQPP